MLGTLGGALVGAFVTLRIERARREHEDRNRWQIDRRRLYARVLAAADAYHAATRDHLFDQVAVGEGKLDRSQARPRPDRDEYDRASHELELLLPMRSRTALLLLDSTMLGMSIVAGMAADKPEEKRERIWREASDGFTDARRALFNRAQKDLGIPPYDWRVTLRGRLRGRWRALRKRLARHREPTPF